MKRVTLKNIAEALGVHVSTVSLALKKHPRIPEKTRKKVEDKAKELGYTPDPRLSALIYYRTQNKEKQFFEKIAYVTSWHQKTKWKENYAHNLFHQGTSEMAKSMGYEVEHFSLREDGMTDKRLSDIISSRGIRGVILSSVLRDVEEINFEWDKFCAVKIDMAPKSLPIHSIRNDQVQAIRLAITKLREKGFKKIGLCVPEGIEQGMDYNWGMGFSWENETHKTPLSIPILHMDYKNKAAEFMAWFEEYKPEVVVADCADYVPLLKDAGYKIPDDVAYLDLNHQEGSTLSGIKQNHNYVGTSAFNYLHGLLIRNEYGLPQNPTTLLVPGEWQEGNSL